jgi:hypothetical protein
MLAKRDGDVRGLLALPLTATLDVADAAPHPELPAPPARPRCQASAPHVRRPRGADLRRRPRRHGSRARRCERRGHRQRCRLLRLRLRRCGERGVRAAPQHSSEQACGRVAQRDVRSCAAAPCSTASVAARGHGSCGCTTCMGGAGSLEHERSRTAAAPAPACRAAPQRGTANGKVDLARQASRRQVVISDYKGGAAVLRLTHLAASVQSRRCSADQEARRRVCSRQKAGASLPLIQLAGCVLCRAVLRCCAAATGACLPAALPKLAGDLSR